MKPAYNDLLEKYLPPHAMPLLQPLLNHTGLRIILTGTRQNTFGQFRAINTKDAAPQIRIVRKLNMYHFLIVFIHELAHYYTWKTYGNKRIRPHGMEWKATYKKLLEPFCDNKIFPQPLENTVRAYAESYFSDRKIKMLLNLELQNYDKNTSDSGNVCLIQELKVSECFLFKGDIYKIIKINRTRSLAKRDSRDGKIFSFYKALRVEKITP